MTQHDDPPHLSSADVSAMLDRSEADIAAGRTVDVKTVLARLDASIARMERSKTKRTTDAA